MSNHNHQNIPIFFNEEKLFAPKDTMTGEELRSFFQIKEERDLYLVNGDKEEKVLPSQIYEIKPGNHYEDAPKLTGGNGDVVPIPSLLERHLAELVPLFGPFNTVRDGQCIIVEFPQFPLPCGVFNKNVTSLKLIIPVPYPLAQLDMVWLESGTALATGSSPYVVAQEFFGEVRTRISCHVNQNGWNPERDNVKTFLIAVVNFLKGLKVA